MEVSTRVAVFAGTFASQPLVFAHLLDAFPALDLDHVEVICNVDPHDRLSHALPANDVAAIEDALGLHTTVVLIFAEALPPDTRLPSETARLMWLATLDGRRHSPD